MLQKLVFALLIAAMAAGAAPVFAFLISSDTLDTRRESAADVLLDDNQLDRTPADPIGLIANASDLAPPPVGGSARPAREAPAGEELSTRNNLPPIHDPLASMLRSLVNTLDRSGGGNGATADASGGSGAVVAQSGARVYPRDPALEAHIQSIKEAIAWEVETALLPQVDEGGRVSFSMLGVGGFHVDKTSGSVSVGFRDYGFQPVVKSVSRNGPWVVSGSGDPRPTIQDRQERLALFRMVFFVWDIISHPATIGIACLIFFLRLGMVFASIRQIR